MDKTLQQPPQQSVTKADPSVVQFQRAAKILCEKTGEDPNATLTVPHPMISGVMVKVPYWYSIAERMYGMSLMLQSISEAKRQIAAEAEERKAKSPANDAPVIPEPPKVEV